MKCFYHTDLDGKCSAAIVYKYYKENHKIEPECIPINYNMDFPFESIKYNELVIIVDFSLQKEGEFDKLLDITKNIVWIDHHKTAIEKHKNMENLNGIRSVKKAGCELTWDYYYPDKICPEVVRLLGDYDTWTFKYGEETNHFQQGIRIHPNHPQYFRWSAWFENKHDEVNDIVENGRIVILYRDNYYKGLIISWSFMTEFEGYKAIACNAGSVSAQMFESVTENYDIMLPFVFDGNQWIVSIYTKRDDIDVSEIAKKYKGGGHRKAAGFECKELPFKRV